jgi:sortase A
LSAMRDKLKRNLGWVEAGLYLGGLALLAGFFILRLGGEQQRAAGVQAFHEAIQAGSTNAQVPGPAGSLVGPTPGGGLDATIAAPNQELWADKRIREYEESLLVEAAPPMAVMTIAKLDIEVPVYDGADDLSLNRGVGRIKGTARLGSAGNLGIAGHRDGFFRGLKDIALGDRIQLLTAAGTETYTVAAIDIVDPSDVSVLAPTEDKTLTLVTCYPFYYVGHAPRRFIVKAVAGHVFDQNLNEGV